jgi:hypothetical protein
LAGLLPGLFYCTLGRGEYFCRQKQRCGTMTGQQDRIVPDIDVRTINTPETGLNPAPRVEDTSRELAGT